LDREGPDLDVHVQFERDVELVREADEKMVFDDSYL
jgi:hypothetical protein